MCVFALAPPMPLGGKLFVGLLMLALVGVLHWKIRGRPFMEVSIVGAVAATVLAVFVLEAALPSTYFNSLHDRGVLAALVGAVCAIVLLWPISNAANGDEAVEDDGTVDT